MPVILLRWINALRLHIANGAGVRLFGLHPGDTHLHESVHDSIGHPLLLAFALQQALYGLIPNEA